MIPAPLQNLLDRLTVAWHERAIALKAISFAMVGVVNTVIDFSVFWTAAITICGWPLIAANVLAWLIAVIVLLCDEFLHHLRPGIGPHAALARLRDFRASGVAGMVASTGDGLVALVLLCCRCWPPSWLSILVSFVVNFSLSHFVVFRARRPQGDLRSLQS